MEVRPDVGLDGVALLLHRDRDLAQRHDPGDKKILALLSEMEQGPPPAGGPPPQVAVIQETGKKPAAGGMVLNLIVVVILVLMVWKPGVYQRAPRNSRPGRAP